MVDQTSIGEKRSTLAAIQNVTAGARTAESRLQLMEGKRLDKDQPPNFAEAPIENTKTTRTKLTRVLILRFCTYFILNNVKK